MRQRLRKLRRWWPLGIAAVLLLGGSLWAGIAYSRGPAFRYSNLADAASQKQARSLLQQAGVPNDDADAFFELVDAFYRVPYEGILQSGWDKASVRTFSYDDEAAFDHYDKSGCSIVCRTAAFVLTRDSLLFGDTDLPMAAELDPGSRMYLADAGDRLHYDRLFALQPADGAETSEDVWETLRTYWDDADIGFGDGMAQLVNVYGLTGDKIQNLHAAVALYGEDGVWLLEKYDPLYPFQFSHFERQADMLTYLRQRAAEVDCAVITQGGECLWKWW